MRRRQFLCLSAAGLAAPSWIRAADDAKALFGLDRLHAVHLEFDAENWKALQPAKFKKPFPGKAETAKDAAKGPPGKGGGGGGAGGFNIDYPYAKGTFTFGLETLKDVGLRFKGNSSYISAWKNKKSYKLNFDKFVEQSFHGLGGLNLNNNALDGSQIREAMAYHAFDLAGVPGSRTAFAEVSITPGNGVKEFVGLYTIIEEVDKTFLKQRFGSGGGLLLKPERMRGLEYLGDDWAPYQDRYVPKNTASVEQRTRLIEFARLIHKSDDAEFKARIADFLDVDNFLRFLAANALLANMDSFIGLGHNYYVYLKPKDNRFAFLPWDMNHAFGALNMVGPFDKLPELSLTHPHNGSLPLIERLLALPGMEATYLEIVRKIYAKTFATDSFAKTLEKVEALVKPVKEREAKQNTVNGINVANLSFFSAPPSIKTFVEKRKASIEEQLAGKSKGYVPKSMAPPAKKDGKPLEELPKPREK